jgi:hypothetical protein
MQPPNLRSNPRVVGKSNPARSRIAGLPTECTPLSTPYARQKGCSGTALGEEEHGGLGTSGKYCPALRSSARLDTTFHVSYQIGLKRKLYVS